MSPPPEIKPPNGYKYFHPTHHWDKDVKSATTAMCTLGIYPMCGCMMFKRQPIFPGYKSLLLPVFPLKKDGSGEIVDEEEYVKYLEKAAEKRKKQANSSKT